MASWQKRARIGVAVFGLVFAGIVYSAIRERQPPVPVAPVRRVDPKAIAETYGAASIQLTRGELDYEITFDRLQQYDDGSSRLFGVRISVPKRAGREFVITAREAYAARDETDLQLTGDVHVSASDGFELSTGEARFDQRTGVARAAGEVAFSKGRMRGTGTGMMYDQPNDILRFDASAHVVAADADGGTAIEFSAGTATLDRPHNLLVLDQAVHALRGAEVIDADRVSARLTEEDDVVTYLELRGHASVSGGGAFQSMSARDIDLDYTDDGVTLERTVLDGQAAIAMSAGEGPGREMSGEHLDLQFAPDASLTAATGNGTVRVRLPAAGNGPGRLIDAETFEASGAPGRGLTGATFTSPRCGAGPARALCVVYREGEGTGGSAPAPEAGSREARSRRLVVTLADDVVTSATFSGTVTFAEEALEASAAEALYAPAEGTLRLTGRDERGVPHVQDEQVTIDAESIDVALEGRRMTAKGEVKTELRAASRAAGASGPARDGRMPRLLAGREAVRISAGALDYGGDGAAVLYTGRAVLSQGTDTTIRADSLRVDRATGDLTATGDAVSRIALAEGNAVGRAHEIRYEDTRRVITYSAAPVRPTSGSETPAGASPARRVQLSIPDGDVTAQRIELVLAPESSTMERLEAYTAVTVSTEGRTATGARLTYHAAEGRYVMASAPGVAVRIVDRSSGSCSETTGSTLTFFKGTDRMTVDGKEAMRTQTKGGGPCGPLPLSR